MKRRTASHPETDQPAPNDDPTRGEEFEAAMLPLLQSLDADFVQLTVTGADAGVAAWFDADAAAAQGFGERSGWLFRLGRRAGAATSDALFVSSAERLPADDRRPLLAASLCRLAWRAYHLQPGAAPSPNSDSAEHESIHALRNGLNAALMNSAVLTAYSPELPQRLVPVARQIEAAITRSTAELQRLVALIEDRN